MTEQPVGPHCGNNPNVRLTDHDRKAVADFKARLALQAAVKPYVDAAAWEDGDPLMEVIAATVWKHCARDDQEMPQAVCDDPRTIAAFAAAVARAHAAAAPSSADRAAVGRVRAVLETEAVVGRSALEYRGLIVSALMAVEAHDTGTQQQGEAPAVAALQQEVKRLGLMVDEYGAGAGALTDKLKRVRDLHRETCPVAQAAVPPTAFKCGLCEVLDAPAAPVAQQPAADTDRPAT